MAAGRAHTFMLLAALVGLASGARQRFNKLDCVDDNERVTELAEELGYPEITSCAHPQVWKHCNRHVVQSTCCATCSGGPPVNPVDPSCAWENGDEFIDLEYGDEHGGISSNQKFNLFTTKAACAAGGLCPWESNGAAGASPVPLAVFIHGGSWWGGSKADLDAEFLALRQRGMHVASINYRLSNNPYYPDRQPVNFTHPGLIEDVEAAIDYFKSPAFVQEYNVDVSKIVAMGSSAGGHLVSLMGTRNHVPKVTAVVNFYGPVMIYGVVDAQGRIGNMLGCPNPHEEGTACYQEAYDASPVNLVEGTNPPFLSFYGTSDDSIEAGRMLRQAQEDAGADHMFVEVACGSHPQCHKRSKMFAGTHNGICNVDVMYTWIYQKLGMAVTGCSECPVF